LWLLDGIVLVSPTNFPFLMVEKANLLPPASSVSTIIVLLLKNINRTKVINPMNLSNHFFVWKQTDFLRSIPPIFLTLTSQWGNQGMLTSFRELKVRPRRWLKKRNSSSRDSFFRIAEL
jgi:hypothetical protein